MIKNIVFDLGGVIIDLDHKGAIRNFKEIGVDDIEEMLDPYEQKGLFLELEDGRLDAEQFRKGLSEHCSKEFTMEEVTYGWFGFVEGLPQYKLDYISELRKDYNLYLLSNTNPFIFEWAKTSEFSEKGLPITEYFDYIYASYQMGVTKPNALIFERMIEHSGMIPSETLFVDDGIHNVEMGKQLGFHILHPKNKEDWREALDTLLNR
jgi:haloacid dehalogenase superfamily, subfamily IA, variant 3 with third motif having DD or ED